MKKNKISKSWVIRQRRDKYVRQSKLEGYRSRAAYKLKELDEKFKIIKNNLILQVTKTVRWRETMASLTRLGISQIVEMGTGKVLTGLAKRGANNLSALNLETSEDIKKWLNSEKLI